MLLQGALRSRNQRRIFWVLVLWIAAWTSLCAEQAFTNTDLDRVLKMSLIIAAFASPFMLLILVPLGLIGRAIGNWKPIRPYRWWVSLVLPLVFCARPVVSAVRERMDPALGFKSYFDAELPKSARHLTVNINNIILSDVSASYSFECSREETVRLIQTLDLKRSGAGTGMPAYLPESIYSPSFGLHKKTMDFNNHSPGRYTGFIELRTDETMTSVYIRKWNT
ncbi:MAG: hypothetical protein ABIS50_25705 [Luteolibacter sp.]